MMNMSFLNVSFITSTILCILIGVLIRYCWGRRHLYYYASKVPGPPAWPIIGNALLFTGENGDVLAVLQSMFKTYGSFWRGWLGQRLYFLSTNPKDLEIALTQALEKGDVYPRIFVPLLGNGLFTCSVDKWKHYRRVIQPTFNQRNLNSFVRIFSKHSQLLMKKLQKENDGGGIFDVEPIMNERAIKIVSETLMGSFVKEKPREFEEAVDVLSKISAMRVMKVWLHPDFIWKLTSLSKAVQRNIKIIREFLSNVIQIKKQEYRANEINQIEIDRIDKKKPFLEYLVELSEQGENWTDEQLIGESVTIMLGGSETTEKTTSFALLMLGMHQNLQEKVYQEVYEIFGDSDRHCTPEDLGKMIYLDRFIKETMRLFPTAPMVLRSVVRDIQLGQYFLPKGSGFVIPILHTHRDPNVWDEPLKFDPDRFLPDEVAKRHPYSFIPFSGGPRNCIGIKYATMSLKTMISTFVRNFHISTDYKRVEDVTLTFNVMLKAPHGWNISLNSRQSYPRSTEKYEKTTTNE